MLKLIIADDERIIRETISTIIDWNAYDIEVTGLCKNGIETYDMIIDENPDIVLTDIRMPGMDGLELIQRVRKMNLNIQFIILSGYGEFEYAKQAMKNGVKHYLLKPCNELQIIDCIRQCREECYTRQNTERILSSNFLSVNSMVHNVLFSIINDSICQNQSLEMIKKTYESYLDFTFTPYRLYYVYFLSFENLESFLDELHSFCHSSMESSIIHGVYVNQTLMLFFCDFAPSYSDLERFINGRSYASQTVSLETEGISFPSLSALLEKLLPKIHRFSMIYYVNNFHLLYTCNYNKRIKELDQLCSHILSHDPDSLEQLSDLISSINDITFFRQIAGSLFIKLALGSHSPASGNLTDMLKKIENEPCLTELKNYVFEHIQSIFIRPTPHSAISPMTQQICDYVEQNLGDDSLTLKYIAENILFMNVDYVSKKFLKEKGIKFSAYLTDQRILKAKELMHEKNPDTIQAIALAVGLGNSPTYFSQLFRKKTGITPSAYLSAPH